MQISMDKMKTTIIVIIGLILTVTSRAQLVEKVIEPSRTITIGETKTGYNFHASLKAEITNKDTVYHIMFRNAKYEILSDYKHVDFF